MPFSISSRTHAEILGLPFHLPCCELNRGQSASALRAVKIVTDQHRAAEAVRKSTLEVNLFCGNSTAFRFQTNESASDAKRTAVHIFTTRDGRESLSRTFNYFLITPEELTGLRINSYDAL